jgi:hypothetical protein
MLKQVSYDYGFEFEYLVIWPWLVFHNHWETFDFSFFEKEISRRQVALRTKS